MSVSSSVVIRHGYTMADIDRISRIAVTCGRWRADMAGADRYTEAHFGIVELLLTADDRPPESELIVAGMRAVDQWVRAEMHHHGWDTRHVEAGAGALPGFCRFWQASGRSPAEERLVERLAVAQVWPRLTFAQQQAVVALAVTGDYVEAAESLGLTRVAFAERLKKARATFGALWFEHETPSRRRRRDKRVLSRSGLMRDGRRLLTESDVDRLRERRAAGVPLRVLAEETGYSAGGLCNLLRGKRRAARDGGGAALGHGCGPRAGGGRLAGRGSLAEEPALHRVVLMVGRRHAAAITPAVGVFDRNVRPVATACAPRSWRVCLDMRKYLGSALCGSAADRLHNARNERGEVFFVLPDAKHQPSEPFEIFVLVGVSGSTPGSQARVFGVLQAPVPIAAVHEHRDLRIGGFEVGSGPSVGLRLCDQLRIQRAANQVCDLALNAAGGLRHETSPISRGCPSSGPPAGLDGLDGGLALAWYVVFAGDASDGLCGPGQMLGDDVIGDVEGLEVAGDCGAESLTGLFLCCLCLVVGGEGCGKFFAGGVVGHVVMVTQAAWPERHGLIRVAHSKRCCPSSLDSLRCPSDLDNVVGVSGSDTDPSRGPAVTTIHIRRSIRAARAATDTLRYAVLSGAVLDDLLAGRVTRTGDLLDRLGADDLLDGHRSWYGRHVAKAYRRATGREPLRVWARHRTTGRFVHVAVYNPTDPALFAGLASYKNTRHLAAAAVALAA